MKLRRLFTVLGATLGIANVAQAQEAGFSTSTVEGSPWVTRRDIGEGAGIRTGSVEIHPGISGELGYDSNFYQRASSPAERANFGPTTDALRFRVIPQLTLRSFDPNRAALEGQRPTLPPPIFFEFKGSLAYNELVALDGAFANEFSNLRNLEGGAGALLQLFRGRTWSGGANASYSYIVEPSNQAGLFSAFNRHTIGIGANIDWRPGGGAFEWTLLDYSTRVTLFDRAAFGVNDNGMHRFGTQGRWRFFPKTAILYDGGLTILDYSNAAAHSGEMVQGRVGLNGLLTTNLGLLLMGGWATSFFRDGGVGTRPVRNFDDFVGKFEAKWYLNAGTRLQEGSANIGVSAIAAGYDRGFSQSYLGDFYQRDRGYGQFSYFFGGRAITTLEGGASLINYPDFAVPGDAFSEVRLDVKAFGEYRITETIAVNAQLRLDVNASRVITIGTNQDDLSFERFRAFLGARWFL